MLYEHSQGLGVHLGDFAWAKSNSRDRDRGYGDDKLDDFASDGLYGH